MATTHDFINYVCEQLNGIGNIRYRKMFGEYMFYIDDKPVVLVCDNTVFVKKVDIIEEMMKNALIGIPYEGSKEHYVLDIDNSLFSKEVVSKLLVGSSITIMFVSLTKHLVISTFLFSPPERSLGFFFSR